MIDWAKDLEAEIQAKLSGVKPVDVPELESYIRANVDSVKQLLRGIGPDDSLPDVGAGARIVFNMSCKHLPALCGNDASGAPETYKNAYDLGKASAKRQVVDTAIEKVCQPRNPGVAKENMYFAAVETTGTGIRFFGDLCLVMQFRPEWRTDAGPTSLSNLSTDESTVVLERNSYDLVRAPLDARILTASDPDIERESIAASWVGTWTCDLLDMVALRVLRELPVEKRRWTGGEIARVVLDDEDYFEVLFPRSFCASEIMEVRTSASDAAAEGDIADRERTGESPCLHELEWRQQRREARRALARVGIPVRVVTTAGRVKGN